jgi:two-component system cell cycle sensor histidine kinase/response regulator CckA
VDRYLQNGISGGMNLNSLNTTALVVEDNDQVRRFEVAALQDAGFEVLEARTGAEGLERLRDSGSRIKILLTDVVMPNVSGVALATAAYRAHPDIRILFISGYSAEILDHSSPLHVPHSFLEKPFSAPKLIQCVSSLLGCGPQAGEFGEPSHVPV